MWKGLLPLLVLAMAQAAFASGPPSNEAILYFEAGGVRMLPASRDDLLTYIGRYRRFYGEGAAVAVLCSGLEDGSARARWLSERRARLVRRLLAKAGVRPIRDQGNCPGLGEMDKPAIALLTGPGREIRRMARQRP